MTKTAGVLDLVAGAVLLILTVTLTLGWAWAGCVPQVAQAPFPAHPDTVVPADLRGPYSGQVVDAATSNPIGAALVYASWAYEMSGGAHAPLLAESETALTHPDGTYTLPVAPSVSQPGSLLRRFTLIIYKAGYVGYRSDLRYEDRRPRHDFAQRGLVVRLERFPEGESHARHLAFLGGGAELRRVAQAELVQASLELEDQISAREAQQSKEAMKKAEPPEPPLQAPVAATLLTPALVQQVLPGKLAYTSEPLPQSEEEGEAQPGAEAYDSVHLKAAGKGETFDAALRLWASRAPAGAEARFARLRAALALVGKVKEGPSNDREARSAAVIDKEKARLAALGDATLRVFDAKRHIYGVVVLRHEQALVVQLSCGAGLCAKEDQAVKLLEQAMSGLSQGPK